MHLKRIDALGCAIGIWLLVGWLPVWNATADEHIQGTSDESKPVAAQPADETPPTPALDGTVAATSGRILQDHPEQADPASKTKATAGPPPDPNRRWIMRQQDYTGQPIEPIQRKPLVWSDKHQQAMCRDNERQLAVSYDQARYYAIHGDRCKTAQFAQDFLDAADRSAVRCPGGFIEYHGYNQAILRNMQQLKALGTESCFGSKVSGSAGPSTKAASPHPATVDPQRSHQHGQ